MPEANPSPSVLHSLNTISCRLEEVLMALPGHAGAEAELRAIALALVAAVHLDAEVALASIFLNQIAGLYAVRHCVETAIVAVVIARAMQTPPAESVTLAAAALTMNAGMLRHAEAFQARHSALTDDERAIVLRHPSDSVNLLNNAGVTDQAWLDWVLLHHENEDGSGYPHGWPGERIPAHAKLIGMADRYCAYVSARNYRRSLLPNLALRKLCIDSVVDGALAAHFVQQLGEYPPGSLVRMDSGESGVVAGRMDGAGTRPVVALRSADGQPLCAPYARVLPDRAIAVALHEDELGVHFSMQQVWGERASLHG